MAKRRKRNRLGATWEEPAISYDDGNKGKSEKYPTGVVPGSMADRDRPAETATFFRNGVLYELDKALDDIKYSVESFKKGDCWQGTAGATRAEKHTGAASGLYRGVPYEPESKKYKAFREKFEKKTDEIEELFGKVGPALTKCRIETPFAPGELLSGVRRRGRRSAKRK